MAKKEINWGVKEVHIHLYKSDTAEEYQWIGTDGKEYSPKFDNLETAKKYAESNIPMLPRGLGMG